MLFAGYQKPARLGIYEEMRDYLVIHEEAVSHVRVRICTRSLLNFPIFFVLLQIKFKFFPWFLSYLAGDIVCLPVCL
jgi:hypothetical protein